MPGQQLGGPVPDDSELARSYRSSRTPLTNREIHMHDALQSITSGPANYEAPAQESSGPAAAGFSAPSMSAESPNPAGLAVKPWWDPELAVQGYDPRSAYSERFWLGIVGPSTLLMLRRFARGFESHPTGFRIDLAETARALGLGAGIGRNGPINRSIDRACSFGLARRLDPATLEVRTHLPALVTRQLTRLPASVRRSHEDYLSTEQPPEKNAAEPLNLSANQGSLSP
jgi:hypothetical protein